MSDWFVRWREQSPDRDKLGQKLAGLFSVLFLLLVVVSVRVGGAMGLTAAVLFTVFAGAGLLAYLVKRAKV